MRIAQMFRRVFSVAAPGAISWILFTILMSACLEPYLADTIREDYGILVVDGFFVPNDSTKIILSRTVTIDNSNNSRDEPNAMVEVEAENGSSYVLKPNGRNTYVAPPLNVDLSAKYRLHVRTGDNHEYYSQYVALKICPAVDSVAWEEVAEHDVLAFSIFSHDPTNSTRHYLWTFDETWQYSSANLSLYYFENGQILPRASSTEIYYCWKTLPDQNVFIGSTTALSEDVVYDYPILQIPQYSIKLIYGYSLLVKQYALAEDAHTYWGITKRNSEQLGTLFDPLPAQPVGNLYCASEPSKPVVGFFSATTVQKKRIFLKRQEIKGPTIPYGPSQPYAPDGYETCESELFSLDEMDAEHLRGRLIVDRSYDLITQELVGYIVFQSDCLDCRLRGGTTIKPPYWE